jgi:hypothetical protein
LRTRFHDPFFSSSTANQREIIGSGQAVGPAVASNDGAITKGDLPPAATREQ